MKKPLTVARPRLLMTRRNVLVSGAATLILGGCDRLSESPTFQQMLRGAERLTYRSQRTLIGRQALAREYTEADISVRFKANGSQDANNLPPGYPEMAEKKMAELEAEARRRWPVIECGIVHRLGRVGLGEASVAIAVSTPHRRDAFDAGQWLIDTLKEVVPIWKKENWADGTTEWVHPGVSGGEA